MKIWSKYNLITITPFDHPDERLAVASHRAGAFSVLDLGHYSEHGKKAMFNVATKIKGDFGIRVAPWFSMRDDEIPENVDSIILPEGVDTKRFCHIYGKKIIVQVTTVHQALQAEKDGAWAVIAKGNESGGKIGSSCSFILFQQLSKQIEIPVFVQGGCGIHTTPAILAGGGAGVVLDSQLSLLGESSVPKALRDMISKLDGTETRVIAGHRILNRHLTRQSEGIESSPKITELYGDLDPHKNIIPLGQDIALAKLFKKKYASVQNVILAIKQSIYGHLRQAMGFYSTSTKKNQPIKNLIAQGPMSSISDKPEFAKAVAKEGGLPFVALSTLIGDPAVTLLKQTSEVLKDIDWGVGMLGFLPGDIFSEQVKAVLTAMPQYAIIAGGKPYQAKQLEDHGIKTFLHVPTPGLLEVFLKDGSRRFIFEGNECGGHIGPLSSFILWEQQIRTLLKLEDPENLTLLFAGGIHDERSSSMIAVMTAPLVAKGAKVGVLMGTAYLYTKEAVTFNAVTPAYQQRALEASETCILSTSPGHQIRCLKSPYVDHFNRTQKRLVEDLGKTDVVWQSLEKMNMGRLQIAAQGKKWIEGEIIDVDAKTQSREGLYMIGQVAALKRQVTTIKKLHDSVSRGAAEWITALSMPPYPQKKGRQIDIAIIGMACVYPGSRDCEAFWANILLSKNLISEVPDTRWNKTIYYDPKAKDPKLGLAGKKTNTKWGGFIPDILFNPLEYGIPPQSMAAIDPLQILSLKVASEALADAGYNDRYFDRDKTSVIFGVEPGSDLGGAYGLRNLLPQYIGELPEELNRILPTLTEDSFAGVLGNVLAGRIANRLDLGGKNFTVDGACASSLVAIDSACKELITGSSDMVIAGGADNHNGINDYLMFSSLYTLSSQDISRPFDFETDGLCMGEGVGAVILKRYDDAVADGDRIYAVIKGIGASSDGKSLGLTAPRKEGQIKALTRAYEQAGICPADVELLEAHGTGTVLGDRTELSSLTDLFIDSGTTRGSCTVSAVKSQIGHTKCAAGVAGLIKSTLAVYYGVLPPTINIQKPNPYYDEKTSPFVFNAHARPWLSNKRVSGISAFGFGGTNFHVVIENHLPDNSPSGFTALKEWPAEIIALKGPTLQEMEKTVSNTIRLLSVRPDIRLRDIAHTLWLQPGSIFATIIAEDTRDLLTKLKQIQNGTVSKNIHHVNRLKGKVAFLFPGQGSQRPGMLSDLFVAFPFLRICLEDAGELGSILFPGDAFSPDKKQELHDAIRETTHAQPLLGMTSLAMAMILVKLGINPDMLAGHSYGELPALCLSGALDRHDLVGVSQKRALSIIESVGIEPGTMAAVFSDYPTIEKILADDPCITVANQNSPYQSVIAGSTNDVRSAVARLKRQGISTRALQVHCAFHSPLIQASEKRFRDALTEVKISKPRIPVWSNTTADLYPDNPEKIKDRLAEHLVKPVLFADQIKAMEKEGATLFIEVGPGKVLTGLVRDTVEKSHVVLNTDEKGKHGIRCLLESLAGYIATGREIHFETLFKYRDTHYIDLNHSDTYRLNSPVWVVNGFTSTPDQGDLPENAMVPLRTPISISHTNNHLTPGDTRDETVVQYLNNVKEIMAAQRDVMLGYLGHPPEAPAGDIYNVNEHQVSPIIPDTPSQIKSQPSGQTEKTVEKMLMDIVSDKTGYPPDMLDVTLDLEADLSIDSIKRIEIIGELTTQLGIESGNPEEDQKALEALSAIKTLAGILEWLENKADLKKTESENRPHSSTDSPPEEQLSYTQIRETLIEIVADKTGYPSDMLDTKLDLEADLSIDSIKRVEILNELNTQLMILTEIDDGPEGAMEELAAIKTMEGISEWVYTRTLSTGSPDLDNSESTERDNPRGENGAKNTFQLKRYKPVLSGTLPLSSKENLLTGKTFALTTDTFGVSERLSIKLKERGAKVLFLNGSNKNNFLSQTDAFIHLSPLSGKDDSYSAMDLFELVKQANPDQIQWAYGITGLGGTFGEPSSKTLNISHYQGTAGFFKTLNKEWPSSRCKCIDIDMHDDPETVTSQILEELMADDECCEVGYLKGKRQILNINHTPLNMKNNKDIPINNQSVILALGGAKGITSEIVMKLAKRYGCHFVLVGRSPLPPSEENPAFRGIMSPLELRKAILAQGNGHKFSEIESQIRQLVSERQVRETIRTISESGASYQYVSMDITDDDALEGLIQDLYAKHQRIDGVLHGAGLIEDGFITQKSKASFKRVFDTKVKPARLLSKRLHDDVQFVVFFSSIASAFGNRGQIDYSSANDVLDKLANQMNQSFQGRILSINWGPWSGKGMVSEALEKSYGKSGIGLISPDKGATALINELRFGKKKEVRLIIMAGRPDNMLLQGEVVDEG